MSLTVLPSARAAAVQAARSAGVARNCMISVLVSMASTLSGCLSLHKRKYAVDIYTVKGLALSLHNEETAMNYLESIVGIACIAIIVIVPLAVGGM